MEGCAAKNSSASSTLIASTSPTVLPRSRTWSVSGLKRAPPQPSQVTRTSGRNDISIFLMPWPSQASQRPPEVLNEKRLACKRRLARARDAGHDGEPLERDAGIDAFEVVKLRFLDLDAVVLARHRPPRLHRVQEGLAQ